ncbi:MAG: hypothetical protein ABI439_08860 [Rhodospirillales bacterium]
MIALVDNRRVPRYAQLLRTLAWAVGAIAVLMFGVLIYVRLRYYGHFAPLLFDDAYFFVRYAQIFEQSGVFGWNVGEGAVHGNTSQLYQVIVTAIYAALHGNIMLTPILASMLGAIAYIVAVPLAYLAASSTADKTVKTIVCAAALVLTAFDAQLDFVASTGMETTWAMALVAFSLAATFRLRAKATSRKWIAISAALIALVYAVRPDAALLALAAPAGMVVFNRDRTQRRVAAVTIAGGLALIGIFLAACWLYYGDPLPLAFVTKSKILTSLPTAEYPAGTHLAVALRFHLPELALCVVALLLWPRLPPALRGAILGVAIFGLYHFFAILPIMAGYGRFYAPAAPVIVVTALLAVELIVRRSRLVEGVRSIDLSGGALLGALALLLCYKTLEPLRDDYDILEAAVMADDARNMAQGSSAYLSQRYYFFGSHLPTLAQAMQEGCTVASTEDGLLSAIAKGRRMIDMSGLHDRRMVHSGFSADRVLLQLKPDVLIMPHRYYVDWIRMLHNHPALARDYDMEGPLQGMTVAIGFRRDSACAQRTRRALLDGSPSRN